MSGNETEEKYFLRFLSFFRSLASNGQKKRKEKDRVGERNEGRKNVINYLLSSNTSSQLMELKKTEEIIILTQ